MTLKHLLTAEQLLDKKVLKEFLDFATKMDKAVKTKKVPQSLKDKIVACLFFEPSTRTRLSFSSAALRLGAKIISMENGSVSSSAYKGESIEDTSRMVNGYADAIVMRHPKEGSVERAAKVSGVPVINAGDGGNEHPTQALIDLYTIKKEIGRLDNLKVVFGFDPLHSRTIRSLSETLAVHKGNEFVFISPKSLRPDAKFLKRLKDTGTKISLQEDMKGIGDANVIYTNRLQEERFKDKKEFEKNRRKFILAPEHLKKSKAIVLDPLPRIDEIELAVDDLPNAKYFEQARNGLFVRMAILHLLVK